ncbi:MAG TPA: glycosyltransferase [Terracidiphilus sp.]|nr:glycosyltransferase [Terracidiphilus sp.]
MRIIHVAPPITDEAFGSSYSLPRMCESLIGTGVRVKLAVVDWAPNRGRLPYLKTFPRSLGPRRLGLSPSMRNWLEAEATSGKVDLIHAHGLWTMPNIYPARACRRGHRPLVVSPRGMLSTEALSRKALQKRIFWHLLQGSVLRAAACFHATTHNEYEDIRRLGLKQPVCILPNGVDVPPNAQKMEGDRRILLFLGRVHPKKGVDLLLRSWQSLAARFPNWELQIAGPDHGGYLAEMQALASQLRLDRVIFRGPLYGEEKWQAFRSASLFVLPTHSENFGMTVAESLAAGTPAIVSRGAPWSGLEEHGAGWWIDLGVEPLVKGLEHALGLPSIRLAEIGRAGRDWMIRDYSWERVGSQLWMGYRWLLEGGEKPAWIELN